MVLVFGSLNIDLVTRVIRRRTLLVSSYEMHCGGTYALTNNQITSEIEFRVPLMKFYLIQSLPILTHIISLNRLDAARLVSLPWNQPFMEVRDVFALIENAAGDAILNLRGERPTGCGIVPAQ